MASEKKKVISNEESTVPVEVKTSVLDKEGLTPFSMEGKHISVSFFNKITLVRSNILLLVLDGVVVQRTIVSQSKEFFYVKDNEVKSTITLDKKDIDTKELDVYLEHYQSIENQLLSI